MLSCNELPIPWDRVIAQPKQYIADNAIPGDGFILKRLHDQPKGELLKLVKDFNDLGGPPVGEEISTDPVSDQATEEDETEMVGVEEELNDLEGSGAKLDSGWSDLQGLPLKTKGNYKKEEKSF